MGNNSGKVGYNSGKVRKVEYNSEKWDIRGYHVSCPPLRARSARKQGGTASFWGPQPNFLGKFTSVVTSRFLAVAVWTATGNFWGFPLWKQRFANFETQNPKIFWPPEAAGIFFELPGSYLWDPASRKQGGAARRGGQLTWYPLMLARRRRHQTPIYVYI